MEGHRTRQLWAVITTVATAGFATGLTIPLVSLRLDASGHNELVVGLMAAALALGFVLAAPFVRGLAAALGVRSTLLVCMAMSAASIALLEVTNHLAIGFVLRMLMGAASGILIALGETLVNQLSPHSHRGRVVAVYTTTFTVCQLCGPATLSAMDVHSLWPVALVLGVHLASTLAFGMLFRDLPTPLHEDEPAVSIRICVRRSPELFAGVMFFALFDAVMLSLFPLYGLHHGHAAAVATFMVTVVFVGDAALQIVIGWLADRTNARHVFIGCGAATLGLCLGLPAVMPHPGLLWPCLVLLGAVAGGIYTLALIQIGQRFQGQALVAANASASLAWGAGGLLGPLLAGGAAFVHPGLGFPLTMAVTAGLFLLLACGSEARAQHG